ncbi:hypothetical protein CROQUDRAFT_660527, partial [Cronartium quercuum f. sp. fusiforme G11]
MAPPVRSQPPSPPKTLPIPISSGLPPRPNFPPPLPPQPNSPIAMEIDRIVQQAQQAQYADYLSSHQQAFYPYISRPPSVTPSGSGGGESRAHELRQALLARRLMPPPQNIYNPIMTNSQMQVGYETVYGNGPTEFDFLQQSDEFMENIG